MGLTIRFSKTAAEATNRLPTIDKKAIRAVLRLLASAADEVRMHPKVIRERDAPDDLVLYTVVVGDWKVVMVLDADDLVVTDLIPWNRPAL